MSDVKEMLKGYKKDVLIEFIATYCEEEARPVRLARCALSLEQDVIFEALGNLDTLVGAEADQLGVNSEEFRRLTNEWRTKFQELKTLADRQMTLFDLPGFTSEEEDVVVEGQWMSTRPKKALPAPSAKLLMP